ncbi:MAG TPA: response regulator [Chitinophagaceae bacterium]|nr:response regulator [Chitinophagaceae bacterium]
MRQQESPDFIVIDDDFINNLICETIIQSEYPAARIDIFTNSQKALEYINATYANPGSKKAVLLLDIDIPAINGWEILDNLNNSSGRIKQQLKMYILTSSVKPEDRLKAREYIGVSGYIEKPLSKEKLQSIYMDVVESA